MTDKKVDRSPAETLADSTGKPESEFTPDEPMPELDELTWEDVEDGRDEDRHLTESV